MANKKITDVDIVSTINDTDYLFINQNSTLKQIQKTNVIKDLEIDSTLSVSGQAADAKITGDKITELKGDLSQLSEEIGNLERKNVTAQQWALLVSILRKGVFIDDESSNIDELESSYDRVPSTGIVLSSNSMSVTSSAPFKLMATVSPSDSTDVVKWTTSDPNVATVTNGTVTPVGDGTAVITATAGDVSDTCTLNVTLPVTYTVTSTLGDGLSLSNSAAKVDENGSYTTEIVITGNYEISTVTVTMGGTDVTSSVYADGTITISSVTGDIVITATSAKIISPITDGLQCNYDFRGATMESYNLTGWGDVYRTFDKTGNEMIFGSIYAEGDATYGLKGYPFRDRRLASSETTTVDFGENYTVQSLYYDCQPSLLNWALNVVEPNKVIVKPVYYNTYGSEVIAQTSQVTFVTAENKFKVVTYVVSGANIKIYYDNTLLYELDGNSYEDFDRWKGSGCPISVYNTGYCVAFVGYNRALSEVEIVDNIEYFESMEVSE